MSDTAQVISNPVEISAVAQLGDEAMALARPEMHPVDFVMLLMNQKLYSDAVRFLAHAMPRREAVWWGWMCARRVSEQKSTPPVKAALEITEKWIAQPSEENRRAAHAAAEKATLGTAAGCAALGAFFSGGSIAPPEAPPVPPGEFLTAKAISGAVIFAALSGAPLEAPEKFNSFVAQGLDVTNRIKLWQSKQ